MQRFMIKVSTEGKTWEGDFLLCMASMLSVDDWYIFSFDWTHMLAQTFLRSVLWRGKCQLKWISCTVYKFIPPNPLLLISLTPVLIVLHNQWAGTQPPFVVLSNTEDRYVSELCPKLRFFFIKEFWTQKGRMPLYMVTSSRLPSAQGQQTHRSLVSSLWDMDAWRDEKRLSWVCKH